MESGRNIRHTIIFRKDIKISYLVGLEPTAPLIRKVWMKDLNTKHTKLLKIKIPSH
jgi:hypothetical protein